MNNLERISETLTTLKIDYDFEDYGFLKTVSFPKSYIQIPLLQLKDQGLNLILIKENKGQISYGFIEQGQMPIFTNWEDDKYHEHLAIILNYYYEQIEEC